VVASVHLPALERFTAVRLIGAAKYSPTGEGFAYIANTTGLPNIWWQDDGGGFARQLTNLADNRVSEFVFSPDGSRLAFVADHHGDEMHQVYVMDTFAGWPRRLTDAPEVQYTLAGWTPDGTKLVVTGNDRDPMQMDPQLIDAATGDVTRLLTGGQFYAFPVSPDGKTVPLFEFVTNTRQRLWLLDLETGEKVAVLGVPVDEGAERVDVKAVPLAWRSDSSGLYATTDIDHEYSAVVYIDRASRSWRHVVKEDLEVEDAVLSRNGARLAVIVNDGGATSLRLYAIEGGVERPMPAPDLPLGVIASASFHPSGERLLLGFTSPTEATNLSIVDVASGARTTVEQSMLGGIDPDAMTEPALITYPSFDRDVPAWLYRPVDSGPHPVVLFIHGGPESQEQPTYGMLGLYQYLLSRGIGVLAPNIRGSTGYGKTYQKLIHHNWGGDELKDLAVAGGSFGGFATLSAMTRLPDRWAAGVDLVGPSNLITFVDSVPPFWREAMAAWVGDPVKDRDLLIERSPITYVDDLRAPLLVIQGKNDPRVVQAESDQMVERLRERGVDVEYVVDETAGHGPPDRDGWVRWLRSMAEFLERHLLD
jgi:dipeptidyl aminopeptidase/acylaminoacyl peptidase